MRYIICLVVLMLVSSCANPDTPSPELTKSEIKKEERHQTEMALRIIEEEESALLKLYFPIIEKNAALCPKVAYDLGMVLWSKYSFHKDERPYVEHAMDNVDEYVRVNQVYAGTSAEASGVKKGDILIELSDKMIDKGRKGHKTVINVLKNYKKDHISAVFKRRDTTFKTNIALSTVCDYPLSYEYAKADVNAYANGKKVFITRGMNRFTNNDDEMASVMGHELAHNVMYHSRKGKYNRGVGHAIGGIIEIGLHSYSKGGVQTSIPDIFEGIFSEYRSVGFEEDADYVGMYFLERAGFDIAKTPHLERRFATENSISAVKHESTHPTTVKRFLSFEKIVKEIEQKKQEGLPLFPNKKNRLYRIYKTDFAQDPK